jgi:ABC-2 type transport system permease protein
MHRMLAIFERDMRRFRRSPALIVMSLLFPICQLVVLGYAFGGQVRNLKLGVVDQDHRLPAVKLRELCLAVTANARTFETIDYSDPGQALTDLRNGRINGVLTIPAGFSQRMIDRNNPGVALIEDNTDGFRASAMVASVTGLVAAYNQPTLRAHLASEPRLDVVEVYPYVPYVQYLLPGSTVMSIFMMVMMGGGIIFIDDKARGLHEGYLVTPISKLELITGFNLAGTVKAVMAGSVLMTIGAIIAGIPNPFEPVRLFRVFAVIVVSALALVSMMFFLMVRVTDPLVPRAMFGVLNTFLFFPSGAVYPQEAFPGWMQVIAKVDPMTYIVHALKNLMLKNTSFTAITFDLTYLIVFAAVAMTAATSLFKRTL